MNNHHPSVDIEFIIEKLIKSGKIVPESLRRIGNTSTLIVKGTRAIYKRTIVLRCDNNDEVNFNQSAGLAARFNFMGELLKWFEENKDWKEGDYFEA